MTTRTLDKTGWDVSAIGFGAWAIGGSWGAVDDAASLAALHRAVELGVAFFDTADVYSDGRSERLLGQLRRDHPGIRIATKAGRRLDPHVAEGYTCANLTAFVERSLTNLGADALDLVQLHCPPSSVYDLPEVFGVLDDLVAAGKVRHYGVSVETLAEALKALTYPGVATVQIIFNLFRQRPAEELFEQARAHNVGVLARPARLGTPDRQADAADGVRARRPPRIQPSRRGVRPRRDVLGRRLRRRAGGRRGVEGHRACGHEPRPVRAPLDPDGRRRHVRHPGRADAGPGRGKRLGRRPPPTHGVADARGARGLRSPHPAPGAPPLVIPRPTRFSPPRWRRPPAGRGAAATGRP